MGEEWRCRSWNDNRRVAVAVQLTVGFLKTVLKHLLLQNSLASWPFEFLKLWTYWRQTLSVSYGKMVVIGDDDGDAKYI